MRKIYYGMMRDYHFAKAAEALVEAGKHLPNYNEEHHEYFAWMRMYRRHIDKFLMYCDALL